MPSDLIEPAARIFISYAHADNDLHSDAVRHFCDDLRGFFHAETGTRLDTFFDHTSIGWGEDWRSSIEGALLSATIFVPIVTMQYFTRSACRDELNAFYANANRLGAEYLILPIVIAGASRIVESDARPEVRLVESLQFQNLQQAFLAGRGTREWREALSEISNKLAAIIEKAEKEVSLSPLSVQATTLDASEDDGPDFLEQFKTFESATNRIKEETEDTLGMLTRWGEVFRDEVGGRDLGKMNQDQMRVFCIRLANNIAQPSLDMQESGFKLSGSVTELDASLRGMLEDLRSLNLPATNESLDGLKKTIEATFPVGTLSVVTGQMTNFLDQMRAMEMLSSPLRRALRPARLGLERLRDAMRVIDSWGQLGSDG